MKRRSQPPDRRLFLTSTAIALTSPFWTIRGAYAEELTRTPAQTEGPFYPNKLPLDTDNDLLIINDAITPAVGEITHLTGQVLDAKGRPLNNAVVEIWQCDANGVYLHTNDSGLKKDKQDKNFQGFGRFITGKSGEYYFRTIKPVPYPGRTPHIHFKIKQGRQELLTTQLYIKGHPGNEKDGIWRGIRDEKQRNAVTVDFTPVKGSKLAEWNAHFVIILGVTPGE
ncbi:MAG: protocatechuate 3,4-dioxygenase [Gemmataceae bacterium]|nr:protocatechuate 3,4-dioxygenase [Gemmata sp.]MDW8196901.1 protocatechuate 3,4-dioxygenase [Gemmataceae bacterium]